MPDENLIYGFLRGLFDRRVLMIAIGTQHSDAN